MPIYEYRCRLCGHELEALQKFSDAPLTGCPSCKAEGLVKLVSAAGFHLKGSGWYATDFKGGAKPSGPKPSGDAGTDAKAESKTEPKTETSADPKATTTAPSGGCGAGCGCH